MKNQLMKKVRVTFPPLAEGQTGWELYAVEHEYETPPDERSLYQKTAYKLLMFPHGKSESVWH